MRWGLLGLAAALLLAGCGGSGGGPFAGLPPYDAGTDASRALHDAEADRGGPLYDRTLVVAGMSRGTNRNGGEAWVVHLETLQHKRLQTCLFIWGSEGLMEENATYDVAPCPAAE